MLGRAVKINFDVLFHPAIGDVKESFFFPPALTGLRSFGQITFSSVQTARRGGGRLPDPDMARCMDLGCCLVSMHGKAKV